MTRRDQLSALYRRFLPAVVCLILLGGCSGSNQPTRYTDSRPGRKASEFDKQQDRPPSAMTLHAMADILATQGKDRECEFVLHRCIQEHPRFIPAYNSLAELRMRHGRLTEAVDILSKALVIRPRDPVLLNNLGMCLLVHKEYAKALERFAAAAGLTPASQKYRANMATTLGLMGRHEEALALLEQILPKDTAKSNAEVLRIAHEKENRPVPSPES
jgi:Flp pilus assembly protein TadD